MLLSYMQDYTDFGGEDALLIFIAIVCLIIFVASWTKRNHE